MKELKDYIFENKDNKIDKSKVLDFLRKHILEKIHNTSINYVKRNSKGASNEICKLMFADNTIDNIDDFICKDIFNIKSDNDVFKFTIELKNHKTDTYYMRILKDDNGYCYVRGRMNNASGTYPTYKFSVTKENSNDELFIFLAVQTKSLLNKKDLTPDKLFNKNDLTQYKLFDFDELINAKDNFENCDFINKSYYNGLPNNIRVFISKLIEVISTTQNIKSDLKLNDNLIELNNVNITIEDDEIKNLDKLNISPIDLHIIKNNLGELLVPCLLHKVLSDSYAITFSYPIESNNKLTDFIVNYTDKNTDKTISIPVSAKSDVGGGRPSGKAFYDKYIETINKAVNTNTQNDNKNNNSVATTTSTEMDFIDNVLNTYQYSAVGQYIDLIKKFVLDNLNDDLINSLFNDSNINLQSNAKNIKNQLGKKLTDLFKDKTDEDIKTFFKKFYEKINYTPKNYKLDVIPDIIHSDDNHLKCGIIIYPLTKPMVDNINEKYGNVISEVFNKLLIVTQSYLTINLKKGELSVKFKKSNENKWLITRSGLSTYNFDNNTLGIQLK
jgi:hypothetical protein